MSKVRVCCFGVSLEGFGAGPGQSLEDPMGKGGMALHEWVFPTRTFKRMHAPELVPERLTEAAGTTGVDDDLLAHGFENVGAWILGRNMFGPVRGPWTDDSWRGWWGDDPPYHVPVFVLTHHARPPLVMKGGTVFHFVTDGTAAALARAREAAGARDVRIGGGSDTIRQYLRARLIDELHVVASPVLLGSGEPLFDGIDLPAIGYSTSRHVPSDKATHVMITRTG